VIDTHAHLDACADPPAVVVARAREAGVRRIVTVGTRPESWRVALAVAEEHAGVYAALGIHPNEAGDGVSALDELRATLAREHVVAVGETGLDYFRDRAPRDRQRELFDAQLEIARELGKAVVVHTRAAEADVAATLEGFDGTVVLHCFSSPQLLAPALERGYYVSFAGNVTYKNAPDLRLAASQVPADRILAETDAPYLSPQPRRGKPNEPAFVTYTVAALAATRGEDVDALEARIEENARVAFGLP
jgi:TatD DNase family protein